MECIILKKNNESEKINLNENIFGLKYNENLIHQIITSYIKNSHKGIKKQKSRSEVSGGGKKPWKQKGTGRARVGSIRSPLWRGGGKIFAFKGIKSKKNKINKKTYQLSIKIILSQLCRDEKIKIIENLHLENHKTKTFINEIKFVKEKTPMLIITSEISKNMYLASKNIKNIKIIKYKNINPLILLKFNFIAITKQALYCIEEYFND